MPAGKDSNTPGIVVGADGSPSSQAALRWALDQARLTGGTVDAVIARQIPAAAGGYGRAPTAIVAGAGFGDPAKELPEETVSKVAGSSDGPQVRGLVVHGLAAQVLLDASADADLLAVGSHGHGGFAEALLGSVTQHCVHHAHCPVVIMRRPGQ
jgi:nucleotide-binding universal stress UspA family protein